jgi:hypothetical protein
MFAKKLRQSPIACFVTVAFWAILATHAAHAAASRQDLNGLDAVFDADPSLAIDLTGHPQLLSSASFMAVHPALHAYLAAHPDLRSALLAHPAILATREQKFMAADVGRKDRNGHIVTRAAVDWFDGFLDQHAEIEASLRRNPDEIDSPSITAAAPALATFLSNNPAFAAAFKTHPGVFLSHADALASAGETAQ